MKIKLYASILFDICITLIFTPFAIILGGVFEAINEWSESVRYWRSQLNENNPQ